MKNYYDVLPGSGTVVTGHFIKVPKDIATGLNPDGSELKAADKGYPLPPTDGSWQTDLRSTTPVGIDGPQWVLEYWSDINNVFQFVRVEDIAYDKRPGMGNVVYIVDSGRGRRVDQSLDTPNFKSTNGRVWRMELDKHDPTKVTSLTVFVEGDDADVKTLTEVHQPDNIETTPNGLLLTEDPGSSQQFPAGSTDPARDDGAALVRPARGSTAAQVVAKVDQSADGRSHGCRRPAGRQLGRVGVDRHRRRLRGVRPRRVPDQHPGAHALGGAGAGRRQQRRRSARLHVQARRRAAAAAPHPLGVAGTHIEAFRSRRP